jgi:hypothetical protein
METIQKKNPTSIEIGKKKNFLFLLHTCLEVALPNFFLFSDLASLSPASLLFFSNHGHRKKKKSKKKKKKHQFRHTLLTRHDNAAISSKEEC